MNADYYSLSIVAPYYATQIYENFLSEITKEDIKTHWEYFFHQTKEMILTDQIDEETINDFMNLNDYGKGVRV